MRVFILAIFTILFHDIAHAVELVPVAKYSIPAQTQVLKVVATKNVVYASVRYLQDAKRRKRGSALVAWNTTGKLLWRLQTEEAYHLVLAGKQLVLAYDSGNWEKAGLIWIDAKSGQENYRVALQGRPGFLAYFQKEKCVVVSSRPERGEHNVLAYGSTAKLIWTRRIYLNVQQAQEAAQKEILILSERNKFIQRINPATGAVIWQREWARGYAFKFPKTEQPIPRNKRDELMHVWQGWDPGWEIFLNLHSGQTVLVAKTPSHIPKKYKTVSLQRDNRLYYQGVSDSGKTKVAVIDAYSLKSLWGAELAANQLVTPLLLGDYVIYFGTRIINKTKGAIYFRELRIYDGEGRLCAYKPMLDGRDRVWDAAIVAGDRLYISDGIGDGNALVAFKLKE